MKKQLMAILTSSLILANAAPFVMAQETDGNGDNAPVETSTPVEEAQAEPVVQPDGLSGDSSTEDSAGEGANNTNSDELSRFMAELNHTVNEQGYYSSEKAGPEGKGVLRWVDVDEDNNLLWSSTITLHELGEAYTYPLGSGVSEFNGKEYTPIRFHELSAPTTGVFDKAETRVIIRVLGEVSGADNTNSDELSRLMENLNHTLNDQGYYTSENAVSDREGVLRFVDVDEAGNLLWRPHVITKELGEEYTITLGSGVSEFFGKYYTPIRFHELSAPTTGVFDKAETRVIITVNQQVPAPNPDETTKETSQDETTKPAEETTQVDVNQNSSSSETSSIASSSTDEETTADTTKPVEVSTSVSTVTTVATTTSKKAQEALPNTGEKTAFVGALLAMVSIVSSILLVMPKIKKEN